MQPRFQCTTLHSWKILNKLQSLKQIRSAYCTEKVFCFFLNESTIHNRSMHWTNVHVARTSPMFVVWPVSNQCDGEWFRVQNKGLSSSNAASLSSLWSSTFSVAPQAEIPDWTDSAQPCESSPPGALALSGSRRLSWRIQASGERERERKTTLRRLRIHLHSRRAGINDVLRRRFKIQRLRKKVR